MTDSSDFHSHSHNHDVCIRKAMQQAAALCAQHNLRFTPIRKRVLELVWSSHAPVAAYELLKSLRKEKKNAEAPTIYRALDFLQQHGMVHKIESLNAYVGCDHPGEAHVSQFLICTVCGQIVEQENTRVTQAISRQAINSEFRITGQTIEIKGICPRCQT